MERAVKLFGIATLLIITILAVANSAFALPVTLDRVEVNDVKVDADSTTRVQVERDNTLAIEVRMTASQSIKDIEVRGFITGYEYNDETSLSQSTSLFDMEANVNYVKKLSFKLPDDVTKDDYKLRIMVSDRNGVATMQNYNLKIDSERHVIKIMGVTLSDDQVKSGSALLATVRIENQGQRTESDVKVTVSSSDLGISSSGYIDEIKTEKQKDSEELYLRVPSCAKPGVYQFKAEISYDRDHLTVTQNVPVEVVANEACTPKSDATAVVVQQTAQPAAQPADATDKTSGVKTALEVILFVLIALLVVVGIILGLSKLRSNDEETL